MIRTFSPRSRWTTKRSRARRETPLRGALVRLQSQRLPTPSALITQRRDALEHWVASQASFALAARRSNIDLVFAKLVSKDAYSVVAAPVYYDYQAIGAYHVNAQHTLRVLGYGSRDALKLLFSNPNDDDPELSGRTSLALSTGRGQE